MPQLVSRALFTQISAIHPGAVFPLLLYAFFQLQLSQLPLQLQDQLSVYSPLLELILIWHELQLHLFLFKRADAQPPQQPFHFQCANAQPLLRQLQQLLLPIFSGILLLLFYVLVQLLTPYELVQLLLLQPQVSIFLFQLLQL